MIGEVFFNYLLYSPKLVLVKFTINSSSIVDFIIEGVVIKEINYYD